MVREVRSVPVQIVLFPQPGMQLHVGKARLFEESLEIVGVSRPRAIQSSSRTLSRIRESLVEELFESGHLVQQLPTLDAALVAAEQRLKTERSNEGQELYFMARILRGTIHQQSLALDDQAVEETNAYTLSNPHFWDDYYSTVDTEVFDWYGTWDTRIAWDDGRTSSIGSVIRPFLRADAQILMVGCGRSEMSQQMYLEGFQHIVNIDISNELLERLQRKFAKEMPLMSWRWMNVSSLSLDDNSMDVAAIREMHRVLSKGGVLISMTDTERLSDLEARTWPGSTRRGSISGSVTRSAKRRLLLYACKKSPSMLDELKSWMKFEL
eukprot:symbB.v1.2.000419.t2/scaffold30.1/size407774/35